MSTRSQSVIRLVRSDHREPDGAGWAGKSDGRGVAGLDPDCAAEQDVEKTGPTPAEPEIPTLWWEVFTFFMEGFALYGAALHPTATISVEAMLAARRGWQPHADDGELPEPAQHIARDAIESNVLALDRVWPRHAQPAHRWTWLRSLGETWTVLSTRIRREREIKRAVVALLALDDRTLRDLGIHSRSEIELMVRYCRDC